MKRYFLVFALTVFALSMNFSAEAQFDMGETSVDTSLPVALSSFIAIRDGDIITLLWKTESEVDNLGFNIYRSDAKDGKYVKVNAELIVGDGTSATPHDYSFTDEIVETGKIYYYYIEDVDFSGEVNKSHIIEVIVGQKKKVEFIPTETVLMQNYPNPFNPETWLPYQLSKDASVTISIYDVNGQLVRQLNIGKQKAGTYTDKQKAAYWDGKDECGQLVSSGLYFYRLQADEFHATKKMIIIK